MEITLHLSPHVENCHLSKRDVNEHFSARLRIKVLSLLLFARKYSTWIGISLGASDVREGMFLLLFFTAGLSRSLGGGHCVDVVTEILQSKAVLSCAER